VPISALALALTGLWLWRTDIMSTNSTIFAYPWDHHKYIAMADGNPFGFHIAPYCWRVGNPLLAKLLPFGSQTSFLLLAYGFVALTGTLSWLLARQAGFSRTLALTGLLFFFSLQWGPKFLLFDFWLPDAAILALMTLAVLLLLRGNLVAFALITAAGVAVKESMLFVLPLVYTFNAARLIDRRAALRTLLAGLPALTTFVVIRTAIPAWNDDPAYIATLPEQLWLVRDGGAEYDLLDVLREEARNRLARFDHNEARAYLFGTFGLAMTILPFFALERNRLWFGRFLPFLLLIASQMLFGHDTERYLILSFPAWLIFALNGVSKLSARFRIDEWTWTLIPITLMLFELVMRNPFILPLRYHALALAIAICLAAAASHLRPGMAHERRIAT